MDIGRVAVGPSRHYGLDGLRGIAALLVAIYHFLYYGRGILIPSMGTFPVYMFFSLSALTMLLAYSGRLSSRAEIKQFYLARFARLFPLLAVTCCGMIVLSHFSPAVAWNAFLTASGLFVVAPGALSVGNGAWSIGIELAFYAVFPALVMFKWRTATLIGVTAASIIVQQVYIWTVGDTWEMYTLPVTFAPFFLFGFLVYRTRRGEISPLPAVFCLLVLGAASFAIDVRYTMPGYLLAMALTVFTLWLAWRSEPAGYLRPVCDFLGRISYSLYLTHWFVFVITRRLGVGFEVFMPAALFTAWAIERWFERPARQWIRKLGPPASVPPGASSAP